MAAERQETTPQRAPPIQPLPRNGSLNVYTREQPPRPSSSSNAAHRQSFSEQLRQHPSSPRAQRHPSLTQQAVQDLMNNPPVAHKTPTGFEGRDWKKIQVHEIVAAKDVHWVEMDTTVEEAARVLVDAGPPNVVLIREKRQSQVAIGTFDYSDLNAYLLLVVGLTHPHESHVSSFMELARKGRAGKPVPLRDLGELGRREAFVTLPHNAVLTSAMETFGSGVHRIIIVNQTTQQVLGVLTQLRLVNFFWEHGRNFPAVEPLFTYTLKDLNVGSHHVKSINGDRPLSEALELMDTQSITSLPVLDNSRNVVGNISHVDVKLLTKSTSLPLLRSSCIHFISVILSDRGIIDGKDSFPVFYVNPQSTLAHTVGKLVATISHRMWIVEQPSPASSAPQTPAAINVPPIFGPQSMASLHPNPVTAGPSISASSLPGQSMSGRLTGVVSLTDVLNLFARASGLKPQDPDEARRRRRRSSSSSQNPRPSLEAGRA